MSQPDRDAPANQPHASEPSASVESTASGEQSASVESTGAGSAVASPAAVTGGSADSGMGQRVASGFAWVFLNTIATKVITLLSQLVLGWLLLDSHFGVVASVTAICTLANPGNLLSTTSFLSRRPRELHLWINACLWLTLMLSSVGLIVTLAASPLLAGRFGESEQFLGCLLIGILGNFVQSMTAPYSGVLNSRMAFGFLTRVGVSLFVAQAVISIGLAKLGMGAYSIIIPTALLSAVRLGLYVKKTGVYPKWGFEFARIRPIVVESGWISAGTFAYLVIAQSNYLGLSWFQSEQVTGQYFFGYTLAVQAVFMLSAGLSAVLMPAFAHVESIERRRGMFASCCRQLLLLTPILCVMQTLAFAPFVKLCFGEEKWSLAITLGVILSAGTIFRVVSFPSQALFVAEGRVRLYAMWMLSWAAVFVTVVLLASGLGSALTVAIAVMVFFAIFDPMTGAMAFRLHGGSLWAGVLTVARMHAVPVLAAVLSGLVVWLLQRQVAGLVESDRLTWGLQLLMPLAAPMVYVPLIWLLSRQDFREAKDTLDRLVIGRIMGKVRPRASESAQAVS